MRDTRMPQIIYGQVSSAGLAITGSDYSSRRTGAGQYLITLPNDFRLVTAVASVYVGSTGTTIYTFQMNTVPNSFGVSTIQASVGFDRAFTFIAVGEGP